jgi:small-conductance mechanosensitive channel
MVDIMQRVPRILPAPAPTAMLVKFTAEGLELEAGFWIADPELGTASVRAAVNIEIWRLCQQLGIDLPGQAEGGSGVTDETDKSLIYKPLSTPGDENQD